MSVGQNIRKIRKEKGITQKKLSELTGIAEITIRQYEAGKYKPKVEQVEKLAKALDVTPFDIIGENIKPLSEYSTKELLQEIERRCEK